MTGWHRTSRHERGYGSLWDRVRIQALKRDRYLCQVCIRTGRPTPATQVDHVKPKADGGTDDLANLQSICGPCHRAKTDAEMGRQHKPRVTIGRDGWPAQEP